MVVRNERDTNFRAVLCDTITGKNVINEVPMVNPKWGLRLNGPGPVSISIPVDSVEASKMDIRNATTTLSRSLGISYNDTMLECGPILSRDYDPATGRLDLVASGLWSVFNRRKVLRGDVLQLASSAILASTVEVGPVALQTIPRELVRASLFDNPYADGKAGQLNIVLPAAVAGTETRTYNGFDMRWLGATLQELAELVDMRFRPQYDPAEPTRVQWLMETGTDTQPLLKQPGPPWLFDGTVRNSPVVGFGGREDGSEVAARAYRIGAGQERDMLMGKWTDPGMLDVGMPWTERDTAHKNETVRERLTEGAKADLKEWNKPVGAIAVTVRADMYPQLGMYLPGDYAAIVIPDGNPIFAPGPRACRILAVDGDDTANVRLTLAPFSTSYLGSSVAAVIHERGYGDSYNPLTPSPVLLPSPDLLPES